MRNHHRGLPSVGLVAAGLVLTACGSQPASTPPPTASATPTPSVTQTATPPPVPVRLHFGKVAGPLPRKHRHHKLVLMSRPVRVWLAGAFTAGSYPTGRHPGAFRTFTVGAKRQARKDPDMTLGRLGKRIDRVMVRSEGMKLDVVTTRQHRPVGATARFDLVVRTHGTARKRVHVWGSLFLTPTPRHGWRIFGYDVKQVRK